MIVREVKDLLKELIKSWKYDQEQKKHGHPGTVVTKKSFTVYHGVSAEILDKLILEIDEWCDTLRIPSLTHLFRIPVGMSGAIVIDDVITWLYREHREKLIGMDNPRRELSLRDMGDGNFSVYHLKSQNWRYANKIIINLQEAADSGNVLERDLAQDDDWSCLLDK